MEHYHAVLGVSRSASKEEIKAAFRRKALQLHPDRHGSAPEHVQKAMRAAFDTVNEAYNMLIDDTARYRHHSAPGRAGFNRASHRGSAGGYASEFGSYYSGQGYSGWRQYQRRNGLGDFAKTFARGVTLREVAVFLVAGTLLLGFSLTSDVAFDSMWKTRNRGKLWQDMESEINQRREASKLAAQQQQQQQQQQQWQQQQQVRPQEGPACAEAGSPAGGAATDLL